MFQQSDIKAVQEVRPKLNDEQATELLGFLCDVYDNDPYQGDNSKLFAAASDLMYPEAK